MKNILRHTSSFIAPILLCFVLPYAILRLEQGSAFLSIARSRGLAIFGTLMSVAGLVLAVATMRMFILIGKGTIMPWDPTRKLIVGSLYAHVRNPMILSLIILQLGEALLFASWGITALAAFNFAVNTIYFIYSEEPGLEKRFGAEYIEYKHHVPRWLPRLKPWRPK
jgi:protein-S-isoprenylcysteine O-methyltransferase Ste14